ncbi:hypothetical protein [Streptomyces sp. NPDC001536]|uniref:hypothetical protein n=1 Tax=Streptomyces sp. NPDC001536 TaxID=3364583 RepID=UPI00367A46AE
MLRIIDARTGAPVEAVPARRGLTRVEAHVERYDATALRVLLVADVLVRALELGGTPVWSFLSAERDHAELRTGAATLGVRPFEDGRATGPGPGAAQIIHVVGEGGATPDGVRVAVAPVEPEVAHGAQTADVEGLGGRAGAGASAGLDSAQPAHEADGDRARIAASAPASWTAADPGTLRLALLSRRRGLPVRLDADALSDAHDTLVRWRRAVAEWARQPSRPVPEEARGELRAAWEDDLDVPGVLRTLRWVEASEFPEGARFETYAYADRLLGLELTRELGSLA